MARGSRGKGSGDSKRDAQPARDALGRFKAKPARDERGRFIKADAAPAPPAPARDSRGRFIAKEPPTPKESPPPKEPAKAPSKPAERRKGKTTPKAPPEPERKPKGKPKSRERRGAKATKQGRTRDARGKAARALGVAPGAVDWGGWRKGSLEAAGPGWAAMSGAFPEMRPFRGGAQLLGYLEGRPGVTKVLRWETWGKAGSRDRQVSAEVKQRIKGLELVRETPAKDRAKLIRDLELLYLDAEDHGVNAEFEIEYETATGG